jgi:hypothetical protein
MYIIHSGKNGLGYVLGDFSQTHLVTLFINHHNNNAKFVNYKNHRIEIYIPDSLGGHSNRRYSALEAEMMTTSPSTLSWLAVHILTYLSFNWGSML